ncbi:MAG: hypothetical protein M4579_000115 [Chaenotheca gracillima]|nr:MAG: hypothetical protein M4579_000115 [Chaenotheca gracillima]
MTAEPEDDIDAEHRAKRVKTEGPGAEADDALEEIPMYDMAALAAKAAEAAIANMNRERSQEATDLQDYMGTEESGMNGQALSPQDQESTLQAAQQDVDLSSVPTDPTEVALWVAKQISNFGDGARGSDGLDMTPERQRVLMHPPAIYTRRFDEDDDPTKVAERERVREENRERKKRWRESNAERNKDNDLRCRINKRAKQIYGPSQSAERRAWIESEFNKRRAKRESKESLRSFDDGFPGFGFAPGFSNTLFPAPGNGPQGETNAAGLLLANALLGVGSDGVGPNAEAANALRAALEGGSIDPRPFTEALRAMAANPEIMDGINAILGGYPSYEDGDANSGDDEANGVLQSTESRNGIDSGDADPSDHQQHEDHQSAPAPPQIELDGDQSDIVKALNAATAMLNDMNETNGDDSTNESAPAVMRETGEQIAGAGVDNNEDGGGGLDPAQMEALLALASGQGQPPSGGHVGDQAGSQPADDPQQDGDISVTLQRIIQQVMSQRQDAPSDDAQQTHLDASGHETARIPRLPEASSNDASDPYGITRNPASALSSLLQCAGMSINTIMPSAQSKATSQLYARLSNQSRSSTPMGGGIDPSHARAFGSTAAMNQRMLARPNAYSRPLHTLNTTPKANGTLAAKSKDPERERKAKSFGFPPLPGRKISLVRKASP